MYCKALPLLNGTLLKFSKSPFCLCGTDCMMYYIANLKCTPSDTQMYLWGHMYPKLGTSVSERQHRHFRCSAFLFTLVTVTHFTLHLISDWRVSDSSPLAYHRERTCELDIGAFLHCKDSKELLRALGLWYCESWGIGENEKVKPDSTSQTCFL